MDRVFYNLTMSVEVDPNMCDFNDPEQVAWFEGDVLNDIRLFWSNEDFITKKPVNVFEARRWVGG